MEELKINDVSEIVKARICAVEEELKALDGNTYKSREESFGYISSQLQNVIKNYKAAANTVKNALLTDMKNNESEDFNADLRKIANASAFCADDCIRLSAMCKKALSSFSGGYEFDFDGEQTA